MNSNLRGAVSQFNFSDIKLRLLYIAGLACFTFFHANYGMAQIVQPNRYERSQKKHLYNYAIISLEEEGLALLQNSEKSKKGQQTWEVVLLDTTLQERKKIEFETRDHSVNIGYQKSAGGLFLLFRVNETTKTGFELIEITTSNGELKQYSIDPDLGFTFSHFTKAGNHIVFGGYLKNSPLIFLYDLNARGITVVPGFYQSNTELVDLRANKNETFNIITVDRSVRIDRNLIFKTYDQNGKMLLEDIVRNDEEKMLQIGIASTLEREDLFAFGTWGGHHSNKSHGFFSLGIDPNANQKITYYDFGELSHYLDYLDPKNAEKIKKASLENKSKKNPDFSDYVVPYRVVEYKDGYLLLAEASTFENLHLTNPYNKPVETYTGDPWNTFTAQYYFPGTDPRSSSMYLSGSAKKNEQEVKKNEAILISFDAQGKLMWDYSFNLNGIRVPTPKQISDFALTGDRIFFLYKDGDRLNSKSIELKGGLSNEMEEKIESLDPHDLVQTDKDNQGEVKYWYGNSFYVWGYQTIKNATKEQRSRNVLYVNKIVAH